MAGPLKSGDRTNRAWIEFNRLQDLKHQVMARNEVVNTSKRVFNAGQRTDVDVGSQMFQLVRTEDDYLVCYTWDGTTAGTDEIAIAKQYKHRISLTTETILGTDHSYSYSADPGGDPDNPIRHDDDSSDIEDQRIVPPWCPGDIIYADSADTGVQDVDGNDIGLLVRSDSRQWAALESGGSGIDGGAP
jgi:hypothetical protein